MKRVSTSEKASRWGVYLLRKKAERLGSVEARDKDRAEKLGIKEFEVAERDRWRVSVQPER